MDKGAEEIKDFSLPVLNGEKYKKVMEREQGQGKRISEFVRKRIPYVALFLSLFIPTLIRFILGEIDVYILIDNLFWTFPILFFPEKWIEKTPFGLKAYYFLLLVLNVDLF